MKILMTRPKPSPETIGLQHLMIVEPLELEILSALRRESDQVVIVDMLLENRPFESFLEEHEPDVLCLTGYITNVSCMIAYCQLAKKYSGNITTIVGGVHCEVCPEDFEHESIDFRMVRNAGLNFTELLNHIEQKSELPDGVFRKGDSLENTTLPEFNFSVPLPDRNAVAQYRHKYFYIFHDKVALLKSAFGCPFHCSFCFCRIITNGKYHQRPLSEVMEELEQIREKEIYIVDDNFLVDQEYLLEFIEEVRKRAIQKHYLVYGRADFIASHPELMHELAQIGLRTVIVGFESFSDEELNQYQKQTTADVYRETMAVLHREKIEVFATIIVSPHWKKKDFKNMVASLQSLGIHFVNLQPLTPLPKTGFSVPEDQLILDKSNFPQWDLAHISIPPTHLSVAEFYREILNAYQSILFRPKVIWKHLLNYRPAMLWKMLAGSYRVTKQYKKKIKEAEAHA